MFQSMSYTLEEYGTIILTVLNKYYLNTDISPLYAAALVLNPSNCTRYIKTHWPKKWSKPALAAVKKLWERYREEVIPPQSYPAFLYKTPLEPKELDTFDQITLSL